MADDEEDGAEDILILCDTFSFCGLNKSEEADFE